MDRSAAAGGGACWSHGCGQVSLIDTDAAIAVAAASRARLIAIDGLPVAGKSTLADRMALALAAEQVFLDDFVKPEALWQSHRVAAFPFDYIRYDEFVAAVQAIARGETCRYAPYDWTTGAVSGTLREIPPGARVVVEGTSALHPRLAPLYDLRFWVESDPATTLSASLARGVGRWEAEWRELFLPSVALYLETRPWERADHRVAGRGSAG